MSENITFDKVKNIDDIKIESGASISGIHFDKNRFFGGLPDVYYLSTIKIDKINDDKTFDGFFYDTFFVFSNDGVMKEIEPVIDYNDPSWIRALVNLNILIPVNSFNKEKIKTIKSIFVPAGKFYGASIDRFIFIQDKKYAKIKIKEFEKTEIEFYGVAMFNKEYEGQNGFQ